MQGNTVLSPGRKLVWFVAIKSDSAFLVSPRISAGLVTFVACSLLLVENDTVAVGARLVRNSPSALASPSVDGKGPCTPAAVTSERTGPC